MLWKRGIQRAIGATIAIVGGLLCAADAAGDTTTDVLDRLPAEVSDRLAWVVQVGEAAAMRSALAGRPVLDSVHALAGLQTGGALWKQLAGESGVAEEKLFDALFGKSALLLTTDQADAWAILTMPDHAALRPMLAKLKPVRGAPRQGRAVWSLPEQGLTLIGIDDRVLIARDEDSSLVRAMIAALEPGIDDAGERSPAAKAYAQLLSGRAAGAVGGVSVLHQSANGWTAARADVFPDRAVIDVRGLYDEPLFASQLTKTTWNAAAVDAFDERAIFALIEPMDVVAGPGPPGMLESVVGRPLVDVRHPPMRGRMGDLRVFTLGEVEGRSEPERLDALIPATAMVLQAKRSPLTAREFDRQMRAFAMAIDGIARDLSAQPDRRLVTPIHDRSMDCSEAFKAIAPEMAVMQHVSMNWDTVDSADCTWCAVATHPTWLAETRRAVRDIQNDAETGRSGRWAQCGLADGQRLAAMLDSHAAVADAFADPTDVEAFAATMDVMSAVARGFGACRWELERPCVQSIQAQMRLEFAPARSAGR